MLFALMAWDNRTAHLAYLAETGVVRQSGLFRDAQITAWDQVIGA